MGDPWPWPYLEKDPNGDKLPVTFLETPSKDALLPDLLQDDDAQHAGCEGHQQQENVRELPAGIGHCIALWSVLAPIHVLPVWRVHLLLFITVNYSFNSSACRILALFAGCCRNVNGLGGGATASFLAFLGLGMAGLCRVSAWRSLVRMGYSWAFEVRDSPCYSYANAHDLEVVAYFVFKFWATESIYQINQQDDNVALTCTYRLTGKWKFWLQVRSGNWVLTTDNCTCEYVLMNQEPFDYASDGPVEAEGCGPTVPQFYIKQITEFWSQHRL